MAYTVPEHLKGSEAKYASQHQEALEYLKSILSGEFKQRGGNISNKLIGQLVGSMTPDTIEGFQTRGINVDPMWMQQYIAPGAVNPEVWGALQDYALRMADRQGMESTSNIFSQYRLPVGTSDYARTQMEGGLAQALRGQEGMALNPYTGQYQLSDQARMQGMQQAGRLQAMTQLDPTVDELSAGTQMPGTRNMLQQYVSGALADRSAAMGGPPTQATPNFVTGEGMGPQQPLDNPISERVALVYQAQGKNAAMRELLDAFALVQQMP